MKNNNNNETQNIFGNVSLLIIGFDPYIDVWNHYFELLNKYWKDRPKTYLASNTSIPDYDGVIVLPIGADAEWSKKVYQALDYVETEYVILLLEDFFTTRPVNNETIAELIKIVEANNIQYCKLLNQSRISGQAFEGRNYLHIIPSDDEYGISLQPAIWEKSYLKECVGLENYNAWIFEMNQVKNCKQNKERINCLADDRNVMEITHAVVQSKYLRSAVRVFNKQGYLLNTDARKVMSVHDTFKYRTKQLFSEYTPGFAKPLMKNIGRIFKFDFVSDRKK